MVIVIQISGMSQNSPRHGAGEPELSLEINCVTPEAEPKPLIA